MVKKLAIRSSVTATLMFVAASASAHHSALGCDFTKTQSAHATFSTEGCHVTSSVLSQGAIVTAEPGRLRLRPAPSAAEE
jgi:hypothetical protein